jgi:Uma2 family endonuclease
MAPYAGHESYKTLLEALLAYLVTEWDLNLYSTGSMTLKAKPVGAEPDTSFYGDDAGKVAGLDRIDLGVSPPPDLVVEIDLSRSRTDKLIASRYRDSA